MPPLARYETPGAASVHSWWSDANPGGATINLHTVARPLAHALPLSGELVDRYMAFLACDVKTVGVSTKNIILRDLIYRLELLRQRLAQPLHTDILCDLLASAHFGIHLRSCSVVRRLANRMLPESRSFIIQCANTLCQLIPPPGRFTHRYTLETMVALCVTDIGANAVAEVLETSPTSVDAADFLLRVIKHLDGGVTCMQAIASMAGELVEPGKMVVPWSSLIAPHDALMCAANALCRTIAIPDTPGTPDTPLTVLRHAPAILGESENSPCRREFLYWFIAELALSRSAHGLGLSSLPITGLVRSLKTAVKEADMDMRIYAAANFALEQMQVYERRYQRLGQYTANDLSAAGWLGNPRQAPGVTPGWIHDRPHLSSMFGRKWVHAGSRVSGKQPNMQENTI
ncbi:hypothetical protein MIND_01334000 [Mycena indigotica]|uniref:Uncharacterized protein n=1 Tax=Mycena indigotica TaxID=2126181 RepID=A0A8H6S0X8_9AGAR|nr:uncharacterized protein MIND_01334000 [Mycena indigotica]KAF7290205.1 hypothetical protein MIND_01334000 [Mycena indigotica]